MKIYSLFIYLTSFSFLFFGKHNVYQCFLLEPTLRATQHRKKCSRVTCGAMIHKISSSHNRLHCTVVTVASLLPPQIGDRVPRPPAVKVGTFGVKFPSEVTVTQLFCPWNKHLQCHPFWYASYSTMICSVCKWWQWNIMSTRYQTSYFLCL